MRSKHLPATGSNRSPWCTAHRTRCKRVLSQAAATERRDKSTAVTEAAPARAAANANAPVPVPMARTRRALAQRDRLVLGRVEVALNRGGAGVVMRPRVEVFQGEVGVVASVEVREVVEPEPREG